MSFENGGLSVRSLAELALIVSRVSQSVRHELAVPSAASLRQFWQSSRSIERKWMILLDSWTVTASTAVESLEQLAPRVFISEMLVRIYGTVLAGLDRQRETDDMIRLARSSVGGLLRVRNEILSRLLSVGANDASRALDVDRLRRRCDRWTDMLLGPIAIQNDCYEFAFEESRVRDFGEEYSTADSASRSIATEHLVSAGMRLKFIQHLSDQSIDEPELVGLTQSILSSFPKLIFHRDGSIRSSLEQKIAASRLRLEQRAVIEQTPYEIDRPASLEMRIDLAQRPHEEK